MSESRNDIETFGVEKVQSCLRKAKHLSPRLNVNDKSPGYDGYISIVKQPTDKIEDELCRVFVQVKTRSKKRRQEKDRIKYSIERKYIQYYFRNYPLVFFVVHRFVDDNYCIYYKELQKMDLYNLSKEGSERVLIEMKKLKKTPSQLDDLFFHFYEHAKIQEMIAPENQINITDLVAGKYKVRLRTTTLHPDEFSLYSIVKEGSVTLYGEKDNVLYYINMDELILDSVKTTQECTLSVKGIEFFNKAIVERSETKVKYIFSESISLLIEKGETNSVSLKYHIPEKLNSLVQFMYFIISLNEVGYCNLIIGGKTITCNLNTIPSGLVDFCKDRFQQYKRIKEMITFFHVDSNLDISKITEHELNIAFQVYESVKNGAEVDFGGHEEESILVYLDIGDLKLAFLAIRQNSGKYRIWDELGSEERRRIVLYFSEEENGHLVPIETSFRDSFIWSCANFNQERYLRTLGDLLACDDKLSLIINDYDFLGILKQYDSCKQSSLLELALSVNSLISKYGGIADYQLNTLNRLQVLKRQRALSEDERNELVDILSCEEPVYRIAALLLLDRKEKAKELLEEMGDEDQKRINDYPISIFFK